ncbi:quinohemoprotein amine dehydrogenase subunit alpha [Motiliproteus sp. MSK22-1]|uniref:quinohemoprotein amine dehydrogenase subunit alpha n=1 Tax=Motiliproteus sp. MSK22-1 TaxID=1897630 RepID=UPI0009786393|nr:quinohemoprotein amine dehydrogenase subunit alpha [Motiliproteus sp. MSK22-1]OMH26714.1 quinohemoprotein amine dehydrogenase subunit alpha [Motiliproteus sp. MSK22-1]
MKITRLLPWVIGAATAVASLLPIQASAEADAEQIVRNSCLSCHTDEGSSALPQSKGQKSAPQWSRISHQRKTPEGWLMSIARMQVMHGLIISDNDRRTLVKYLADRQGLAPEETTGFRYAMERRLNTQESFESEEFTQICARCHSGARVALQRRPASEWEHLVHFHLGQWPTIEYQAMGRDRDWLGSALNSMVPQLAKQFPLESKVWSDWQSAQKPSLAGSWRFAGSAAGRGDVEGSMSITGSDEKGYQLELMGSYADGTAFKGRGQGIVYTGYEWRANLNIAGVAMRQVFAASKDGSRLEGRMFEALHDEVGMDISALKDTGVTNQILTVQPSYIKAGETQKLTIVGNNLKGKLSLGQDIQISKVLEKGKNKILVEVRADTKAKLGGRSVTVGKSKGGDLQVYDRIASIQVVPNFSVARVGGNGGSTPKVTSAFQAEAWAPGLDGKAGTDDDLRIGFIPASWHVEPFDEAAKADKDTRFAGTMDATRGVFSPALAGPNPDRRMSTNNAGNLKVVAKLTDGDTTLQAEGQLIVTVQRWNNPPLP